MQVSFGQKIPIALAQIQNKQTGEFEQATIYEVDCKDEHDYIGTRDDSKDWNFPFEFWRNMQRKYFIWKEHKAIDPSHFYILQNQDYKTLGRIQIDENDDKKYTVEWFDTKENSGYRYVGQTILATVAKEVIDNDGSSLAVLGAIEDAVPFYTDICQFQDFGKNRLYMGKEELKSFIKRTEKRTQGSIINLRA